LKGLGAMKAEACKNVNLKKLKKCNLLEDIEVYKVKRKER
jgi:hypothetical protein